MVSAHRHEQALDRLEAADAVLVDRVGLPGTLAVGRDRATSLPVLGERAARSGVQAIEALAEGLVRLTEEQLRSFPENLFWDQDALVAHVVADGEEASCGGSAYYRKVFGALVRIHQLFGGTMSIRFRYVHDFHYGFDWAKWVHKAPAARSASGPLSVAFLEAIEARGRELTTRIADNDPEYPKMADDGRSRNPFPFCREPAAEKKLFEDLAARDLIPLRAWDPSAQGDWRQRYQANRDERAQALGLKEAVS